MIYTVTLNPSIDYILYADHIEFGSVNRAFSAKPRCGGKGINVSCVLSNLGVENAALGFCAGDTGKLLLKLMDKEKIKHDMIDVKSGETRVNIKIKAQKELDINAPGHEISKYDFNKLLDKLSNVKDGDTVVLSGSLPKNAPADVYARIMERFDGKNVKTIVDASGEALIRTLEHRPFLIKPNLDELEELFGVTGGDIEKIIDCAKTLKDKGARNVIVSMGENGALLLDENGKILRSGVISGEVNNTVGCGDSMVAGFAAGIVLYGDTEAAFRLGSSAGMATAISGGLASSERIFEIFGRSDVLLNDRY